MITTGLFAVSGMIAPLYADNSEQIETNRARWDELVDIHARSAFYDVASFRAGRCTLRSIELEEVWRRARQIAPPPAVPLRTGQPVVGTPRRGRYGARLLGA